MFAEATVRLLSLYYVLLQYTDSINDLRASAVEEMEAAKRKDGLEWVKVDLSQLKPKLT